MNKQKISYNNIICIYSLLFSWTCSVLDTTQCMYTIILRCSMGIIYSNTRQTIRSILVQSGEKRSNIRHRWLVDSRKYHSYSLEKYGWRHQCALSVIFPPSSIFNLFLRTNIRSRFSRLVVWERYAIPIFLSSLTNTACRKEKYRSTNGGTKAVRIGLVTKNEKIGCRDSSCWFTFGLSGS